MINFKFTFLKAGEEVIFYYKCNNISEAANSIVYQDWFMKPNECVKIEKID